MRKLIYTLLLTCCLGTVAAQDCDTLYGGILELQMQTRKGGLLYGNGYCIDAAVVNGGLEMVGGTLSVVDGDTVGQVLRWTGTTWEPRLIIFPASATGDTSYNGITYVPGSPNAHKLGGTLTENTTISGANARTLTLNNLLTFSVEAERTAGTGQTTITAGSTNIAGFDVTHLNPAITSQQAVIRASYTTGNIFRLQNATNVQTEVNQYWDGASHVTDITSTDGVDGKTLRVTKTGIFALSLDKVGAFSEPGIMMWDTLTGELRYQSPDILLTGGNKPDSTFVRTGGQYWGKTISTDVYRTGKVGIGTTVPVQDLHVAGKVRITGSDGTATTITGRDAENDITNVTVSTGLQLSSGVLSIAPIPANQVVFGSGAGINSDTSLKYFPTTRVFQLNDKTINHSIFTKRKPWGGAYSNILSTIWRNAVQVGDSAGARITNRLAFNVDASSLPEIISSTGEIRFDSTILSINGSHPSGLQIGMTTPSNADVMYQGFDGTGLFWSKNNSGQPLYFHKNAPSYSLYMNSSGKIGINNDGPGVGTLDVIQRSDDFLGGIGLRSTGNNYGVFFRDNSNNMYLSENASTRYMWGTGGVFQAYGRIDAGESSYTSSSSIVFPLKITSASNSYQVGAYGLNPEGNVTGGRGDLIVNINTGELYQKRTTSGNTGWGEFLNIADANSAAADDVLKWSGTAWTPGKVGSASIENSGVTAGTYGGNGDFVTVTVNAAGQVTSATTHAFNSEEHGNGTHTLAAADVRVFANADIGNVTINLSGALVEGRDYFIAAMNNGTNTVSINPSSGSLWVDGVGSAATYVMSAEEQIVVRYRSNTGNFYIDR